MEEKRIRLRTNIYRSQEIYFSNGITVRVDDKGETIVSKEEYKRIKEADTTGIFKEVEEEKEYIYFKKEYPQKKIDSISFCISASGKDKLLERCIRSIHLQGLKIPYEVIVVGFTKLIVKEKEFKYIPARTAALLKERGKLYNLAGQESKGEIIVFLDEGIELLFYWSRVIEELDLGEFDLTTFNIYEYSLLKGEIRKGYDWCKYKEKEEKIEIKNWEEEADENTFIKRDCLIVRKEVFDGIKFPEENCNEEDIVFSKKCFKAGCRLKTFELMKSAVGIRYI